MNFKKIVRAVLTVLAVVIAAAGLTQLARSFVASRRTA